LRRVTIDPARRPGMPPVADHIGRFVEQVALRGQALPLLAEPLRVPASPAAQRRMLNGPYWHHYLLFKELCQRGMVIPPSAPRQTSRSAQIRRDRISLRPRNGVLFKRGRGH
jgi:hypothetical protein